MKPKMLLVDVNNLGYAACAATKLTCGDREVQAIFGVINRVQELRVRYPEATPFILWDGECKWRKDLYPDYKAKRNDDPKLAAMRASLREQRPDIRRGLELLGVPNLIAESSEADDLAGLLVRKKAGPNCPTVLISGDRDWIQLVRPDVAWYAPVQDRWVHHTTFLDFTGCKTPAQYLQAKAFQGDNSDNVGPVGGIGEQGATEFLATFNSVPEFLALMRKIKAGEATPPVKIKKAWQQLADNEPNKDGVGRLDAFKRNFKLMNLMGAPDPTDLQIVRRPLDLPGFKAFAEELNFQSILRDFAKWTAPFIH